ncbi:MAG: magnesium-dependent phosphatase-1 [Thermoplasmata archaeon]|mgnify:CR=1 FL=1|nr:magnesium-dependent phosphatase-1 [Thermoplasmata archaeon]
MKWLLAMDLDGTVWDHLDITSAPLPYKKIDNSTIESADGTRIKIFNDAIEFIKWSKNNGAIVTSLSWNVPENAFEALKIFNIIDLFDYHLIEYHPDKYKLLLRLLSELKEKNIEINKIVYVDDRDIHVENIKKFIGNVTFIHIWKEVKNYDEAKKIVQEKILK